jgi:hypothetical protein
MRDSVQEMKDDAVSDALMGWASLGVFFYAHGHKKFMTRFRWKIFQG